MNQLRFVSVSFTYPDLVDPLFTDLTFTAGRGWTGVIGVNGVGKSTLLALAVGRLTPTEGSVHGPTTVYTCEQRTDRRPDDFAELMGIPDATAGRLASTLGLEGDWPYRWSSLSHGERKRAQVAVALWKSPEVLVVDEPTNHLDRRARDRLATALAGFDGIGLIVSHDRVLLDRLCRQCVFLEAGIPPVVRPGGVSSGLEQRARERLEQERAWEQARSDQQRLEAEAMRRRQDAARQDRRRSKRGLRRKDSDAREKIDRARISGADGRAGRLLTQLDGRRAQARETLSSVKRPVHERVGISLAGRRAGSDSVIAREAGTLTLPDGRVIRHPDLVVRPDDRIALQGPNGAGKTSLVAELLRSGVSSGLRPGDTLWIPQEISSDEARRLMDEVRALRNEELGRVISTVSRLASDPERLLQTAMPSPGETRKLMLALGLERRPSLVVMDEPTNHLDLVSMQCMEAALADFEGALLLVSHDDLFVRALVRTIWSFSGDGLLEVRTFPEAGAPDDP